MNTQTTHDKSPLEMALWIETIATQSLVASMKAQMTEGDFEDALAVACSIAQKNAPPSFCFTVEQAVKRIAGEKR